VDDVDGLAIRHDLFALDDVTEYDRLLQRLVILLAMGNGPF